MTDEVRLAPKAWRDLARLADFLASKNPRAAERAQVTLWEAIGSLNRLADRGAPTGVPSTRRLFVPFGRAGYVVVYLVEPDTVTILRMFHALEDRQP